MLDKNTLKSSLKNIFETEGNTAESVAEAIAAAVDTYVKTAEVTVTAPTGAIAVAGSPSAQSNPAPVVIKGNLS